MLNKNLEKLQRHFKKCLDLPRFSTKEIAPLKIIATKDFSAKARFDIYHYAYFARISESLAEDFPKLNKILGEKKFEKLIREYLVKHPSKYASLSEVGKDLPRFIKKKYKNNLKLYETALLEWNIVEVDYSPIERPYDWSSFQNLSPQELLKTRFILSESVRFIKLKSQYKILYRKNLSTIEETISENEFKLLVAIKKGTPVAKLQRAVPKMKEEEISQCFFLWVQKAIFCRFDTSSGREKAYRFRAP
jgi:hypothetical protein